MSEELSVADVLDRAADLIEPEGAWTQGALVRDRQGNALRVSDKGRSCYCMAGALVAAGGPWSAAWSFLDNILPEQRDSNRTAAFNDAPERTQAEVVEKLREAASLARPEDLT